MKGLLIIPAYNEEENIGALLDELDSGYSAYDYIVVNDGSRDATRDILRARHAPYLDLPVNLGIGGGVQAGYLYAQAHDYDIAVQMDGDGQHLPAYLDCLIAPLLVHAGLDWSIFGVAGFAAKVIVSLTIVVLNYFASKFLVFYRKKS